MDTRCTSCGQSWPAYSMPSYDRRRDTFNVCGPCREMSAERERRERFAREATQSPWVARVVAGNGVAKVFA